MRTNRSSSSRSIWDSILWIRPLGTSMDCITVLFMRLLNAIALCIWDKSNLVILYLYGDLMRIISKNMLQLLLVALPLELGALHKLDSYDVYAPA